MFYNEFEVGDYFADLIVEDLVIVELKAAESLCEEHEAQLINYLKATNLEVGLLLNFGKKAEFKRKVFSNDRKSVWTRVIRYTCLPAKVGLFSIGFCVSVSRFSYRGS